MVHKVKAHVVLPVGLKANWSEIVVGSMAGNNTQNMTNNVKSLTKITVVLHITGSKQSIYIKKTDLQVDG